MTDDVSETNQLEAVSGKDLRDSIIRAVDFKLDAILGEATLTLDELEKMEAGNVLSLSTKLADVVSLRMNNIEIAKGELVSVGDNFAIRITHVSD